MLADEVGLGKTIEAGMILKEYMLRGLVRRALILAPASLTWQWQLELREKFDIPAVRQRTEYDWERCNVIVASLDTAKRPPHCHIVHNIDYDLLIVDEAHRLKNVRTANWRFVSGIGRQILRAVDRDTGAKRLAGTVQFGDVDLARHARDVPTVSKPVYVGQTDASQSARRA